MKIAIDGPAGSGKSTVSKQVACILGIHYIDTGAMFRAITYHCLNHKAYEESEIEELLQTTALEIISNGIQLNTENLIDELRTEEIDQHVSYYSSFKSVREFLKQEQRRLGKKYDVVMDGRDIGTVIFPDAEFKFYLNAPLEIRAMRRAKERGQVEEYSAVLKDMKQRDDYDSTREIAPLKKADDAVEIDTSNLSIDEVVERIIEVVQHGA